MRLHTDFSDHHTITMTSSTHIARAIAPNLKPSYSPNLHKFAKKWRAREPLQVWRDNTDGELRIGYIDPEHAGTDHTCGFIGVRMSRVLCNGATVIKERGWFSDLGPGNMTQIEDFWKRYVEIGRCAIDTKHKQFFIGDKDRYTMAGDLRTCTWCGAQHTRTTKTEVITTEIEVFTPVEP